MARKRFITSEISVDERLAGVATENPMAALMWPWMILYLDDWGRGSASPIKIKLAVFPAFPFSPAEIQKTVESLGRAGLVHLYEVDGEGFMAVRPKTWIKYQTYLKGTKRGRNASKIPSPTDAPWGTDEEGELCQEMSRMSADNSECQLTNGNVSNVSCHLQMSVPSPSPSLSLKDKDKHIATPKGGPRRMSPTKDEVVSAYHENCPMLPRVVVWNDKRDRWLKARIGENVARRELSWWIEYFSFVSRSKFLTGRAEPLEGRRPFMADLEWLLNDSNMAKVVEGKYHRDGDEEPEHYQVGEFE